MAENEPKTRYEVRQAGNMHPDQIFEPQYQRTSEGTYLIPSLADEWASRGIQFELTEPVATDAYTSDEIAKWGLKGVTLYIPAGPEQPA